MEHLLRHLVICFNNSAQLLSQLVHLVFV
uniref:Uncharacterized protein n=1 Tax=Rhizophora mucronata TaxID=61149 RepID=A0A2P2P2N3_RHIMU